MLFSIISCTYNSAETIRYMIKSVLQQTCEDWELVILDNGSNDETVDILKEYEAQDSRIKCEYRQKNVGWAKGTSLCLEKAQGQYMMFLGADDLLSTEDSLLNVKDAIEMHQPDIVWTGAYYALYQNGKFEIKNATIPKHRVYQEEPKIQQLVELMQNVYYNSIMHYVKIDFLKKYGIDFWQPYYGDCQGMTEALLKADKMVVMDTAEYVLTSNTSQSKGRVVFDYDYTRQWCSVKENIPELYTYDRKITNYIANRILRNLSAMCKNILQGTPARDKEMNLIEVDFAERFLKAEEWISSSAFGEMMYFAGRKQYAEELILVAGVLYWICKEQNVSIDKIEQDSNWLAKFVSMTMEFDNNGEVVWKKCIKKEEGIQIYECLNSPFNKYHIGYEIVMDEQIYWEDDKEREEVSKINIDFLI